MAYLTANAVLTEYFDRIAEPNGDSYLVVTSTVEDPTYEERAREARISAGRMELHVAARVFGPKARVEDELDGFVSEDSRR